MATVKDTEYEFFAQDDFRARKPDIKFAFDGELLAGKTVNVKVHLLNSLPIALRKCLFQIEGTHIDKQLVLKVIAKQISTQPLNNFTIIIRFPKYQWLVQLRPLSSTHLFMLDAPHWSPNLVPKN